MSIFSPIKIVFSSISSVLSYKMFSFFFFQAEDGIRDIGVTGVQTCALPISRRVTASRGGRARPTGTDQPTRHGYQASSSPIVPLLSLNDVTGQPICWRIVR